VPTSWIIHQTPLPASFQQKAIGLLGPLWPAKFLPPLPLILLDGAAQFRHLPYQKSTEESMPAVAAYPQYRVGDGDTYPGNAQEFELLLDPHKDVSDLAAALAIIPPVVQELYLYGLRGGRRDHEWAILGEITAFLAHRPSLKILDEDFIALPAGEHHFAFQGRFSVLSLDPNQITLTGNIAYPLLAPTELRPLVSRGISNIADGPWQITATRPFFLFQQGIPRWP